MRNTAGFGLIEVIIASGIMVIVGLGFMTIMQNANNGTRNVNQTTTANDEKDQVLTVLSDQATCGKNFATGTMGSSNVVSTSDTGPKFTNNFTSLGGTPVIPVGSPLPPQNLIQIDNWSIIDWKSTDSASPGAVTKGVGILRLYISKLGASVGGSKIVRDVRLVVNVYTAAPSTIYSCYATGTDVFWQQGTNGDQIYYNGNVGIGTSSPNARFQIEGPGENTSPAINGDKHASIYIIANNNVGDYGGGIEFGGKSGQTFAAIKSGIVDGTANGAGYLTLATRNATSDSAMTERVRVTANGFVGIRLTNPGAPLVVGGSGANNYGGTPNIIANGDNHAGGGIEISDDGGFYDYNDGWITYNGSTGLKIGGNNGPISFGNGLLVTGTVGIGTTPVASSALKIGNGSSAISLGTNDTTVGTWLRSGADTVLSTNTGSLFLGYQGNPGKTINIGNSSPGAFQVVGRAPVSSVVLDVSGNLNIGGGSSGDKLYVNGTANVNGTASATAFVYSSDERLKNKGANLDGLSMIESLGGYHFTWKKSGREDVGVMAQEVEKVLPEIVHETPDHRKTVDYARLVAPLIEAVKEQQRQIEENRLQIEALRQKIKLLSAGK